MRYAAAGNLWLDMVGQKKPFSGWLMLGARAIQFSGVLDFSCIVYGNTQFDQFRIEGEAHARKRMDQFVSSFSNQLEVQQKSGRCAELPQKAVGIVAVRQHQ